MEAVLDAAQNVVAAYRYDPFGVLLNQTGSLTQPFGFSTKRYNARVGMVQYEARNYLPEIGRWDRRDPLGEAGGLNLYAFVGNNPVNWVDPWGLYQSTGLAKAMPWSGYFDAGMTAFEQGQYVTGSIYMLDSLVYAGLIAAPAAAMSSVQGGLFAIETAIQQIGTTITTNWFRFDPSGTWGKNGSQSGPHCHIDPIPGSRELMRYHLPSQFRAWRGNLWSILKRRFGK